jgi:hypothetical protein
MRLFDHARLAKGTRPAAPARRTLLGLALDAKHWRVIRTSMVLQRRRRLAQRLVHSRNSTDRNKKKRE